MILPVLPHLQLAVLFLVPISFSPIQHNSYSSAGISSSIFFRCSEALVFRSRFVFLVQDSYSNGVIVLDQFDLLRGLLVPHRGHVCDF